MSNKTQKIRTFPDLMQAEIAKGLLESHNIPAKIYGYSSERPFLNTTIGVHLSVAEDDAERALALVESTFNETVAKLAGGAPWLCGSCGEPSEPQFFVCWNCNASRDD